MIMGKGKWVMQNRNVRLRFCRLLKAAGFDGCPAEVWLVIGVEGIRCLM